MKVPTTKPSSWSDAKWLGFNMAGQRSRGYLPNFFTSGTPQARDFSAGVKRKMVLMENMKP